MSTHKQALQARTRVAALIEAALSRDSGSGWPQVTLDVVAADGGFVVQVATDDEEVRAALPTDIDGVGVRLVGAPAAPSAGTL